MSRPSRRKPETTSEEVASIAAKGLAKGSLNPVELKSVCASALTQREDQDMTQEHRVKALEAQVAKLTEALTKGDPIAAAMHMAAPVETDEG